MFFSLYLLGGSPLIFVFRLPHLCMEDHLPSLCFLFPISVGRTPTYASVEAYHPESSVTSLLLPHPTSQPSVGPTSSGFITCPEHNHLSSLPPLPDQSASRCPLGASHLDTLCFLAVPSGAPFPQICPWLLLLTRHVFAQTSSPQKGLSVSVALSSLTLLIFLHGT